MAKGKGMNSKQSVKSTSKYDKPFDWREEAVLLNLNEADPNRTCEVGIAVESEVEYLDILEKCHIAGLHKPLNVVKCVNYEDLLIFIGSALTNGLPELDPDLMILLKTACTEASQFINNNEIIPCETIAKLLKLYMTTLILEDVGNNVIELTTNLDKQLEKQALLASLNDTGKKGKGKGKEKAKGKGKDKSKGSSKGKNTVVDICAPFRELEARYPALLKPGELQVPFKELFIVLIGFYDHQILKELVEANIPLVAVIEVSSKKYHYCNPDHTCMEQQKRTQQFPTAAQPLLNSQYSDSSSSSQETASSVSETLMVRTKSDVIQSFWTYVRDMFEGNVFYDFLKDTMHVVFTPTLEPFEEDITEKKIVQNKMWYAELCDFVEKIPGFKRQYINYMRHMKLQYLGRKPRKVSVSCFKTYRKILDRYPPDCFSVDLLLHAMVEEVAIRVPYAAGYEAENENGTGSEESIPSRESVFLETAEDEEENEEVFETNPVSHGGVRDQLVNVFKKYDKRHHLYLPDDITFIKCQENRFAPRINVMLTKKPFIVHENNRLEIMINNYKSLSMELYNISMKVLRNIPPAITWQNVKPVPNIVKMMNKYHIETWTNNINVSKWDLKNALYLFLFNTIQCTLCECKLKEKEGIAEVFPTKMPCNILEEKKPKPFTFIYKRMSTTADHASRFDPLLMEQDLYEDMNLISFKWKEGLPAPVLLQKLNECTNKFLCMDYQYCSLLDAFLIRFHNNADRFGCNTRIWDNNLRTPVCIRDFGKYVTFDDATWLNAQEREYQKERQIVINEAKQKQEEYKKSLYPDIVVDEKDFILPGSLKDKALKDAEQALVVPAKKKSADKGKGKGKGKSGPTSPSVLPPAQIVALQKITLPPEIPLEQKLSLRCARADEPYTFIGYDISTNRLQLTDATVSFQSLDGVKVVVDKSSFLGAQPNLSFNITANKHHLLLHYNYITKQEPFCFHMFLANESVIALAKPIKLLKPEVAICEKICKALKEEKKKKASDAYQKKRQEMYFVSEQQDCIIKCLKIPCISQRNIILSENLLRPFLNTLEKLDLKSKINLSSFDRDKPKRRHNLDNRFKRKTGQYAKSSFFTLPVMDSDESFDRIIPKVIVKKDSVSKEESEESVHSEHDDVNYDDHPFPEHSQPVVSKKRSELFAEDPQYLRTKREFMAKLKIALDNQIPVFKICSSKFHKYAYVKRAKSYITLPLGNAIKRILCKPSYCKTKRNIEVTKCFPISINSHDEAMQAAYDFRVSLPSGLMVRNVPGICQNYYHIKQYYLDKGPQCKNIIHEDSRTFMRNGNIMVRNCNGSVTVYSLNGNIMRFEIPYIKKCKKVQYYYDKKFPEDIKDKHKHCIAKSIPMHACSNSLTRFQKILHRTIRRRRKHMIDSVEQRFYSSRRSYLKQQKKYLNDESQYFLIQKDKVPFPEYTLLKPDGKKIKVTSQKVSEQQKYYTAIDRDYRLEQTYFEREDGTHSVLDRDGVLSTQYPDGTRIITWYSIDPNLVYVDDIKDERTKDRGLKVTSGMIDKHENKPHVRILESASEENLDEFSFDDAYSFSSKESENGTKRLSKDGWISVYMYFQYEHPNYATVIFGGASNEMKVIFPNNVSVRNVFEDRFEFTLDNKVNVNVDRDKIEHMCKMCSNCTQACVSQFNIHPLYYNVPPENNTSLLRVQDSYQKIFTVDYEGNIKRNTDFLKTHNASKCSNHYKTVNQRLFVLNKDLSGVLFWNEDMFNEKQSEVNNNEDGVVNTYGPPNLETAIEFRKYIYEPYYERFLLPHRPAKLMLTKYLQENEDNLMPLAYIVQRVLNCIPSYTVLRPLFDTILECCQRGKHDLSTYKYQFDSFIAKVHEEEKQQKLAELKEQSMTSSSEVVEEFIPVITLYEKWVQWQRDCRRLKRLVTEQYVPLYFKRDYDREFSYATQPIGDDEENIEEEEEEISPSAEHITAKKSARATSTTDLPMEPMIIHTDRSKKTTQNENEILETVTEEIQITMPKNLVILCKYDEPIKKIAVDTENVICKTLSQFDKPQTQTEDYKHKMLILTDVKESTKVKIAKQLSTKTQLGEEKSFKACYNPSCSSDCYNRNLYYGEDEESYGESTQKIAGPNSSLKEVSGIIYDCNPSVRRCENIGGGDALEEKRPSKRESIKKTMEELTRPDFIEPAQKDFQTYLVEVENKEVCNIGTDNFRNNSPETTSPKTVTSDPDGSQISFDSACNQTPSTIYTNKNAHKFVYNYLNEDDDFEAAYKDKARMSIIPVYDEQNDILCKKHIEDMPSSEDGAVFMHAKIEPDNLRGMTSKLVSIIANSRKDLAPSEHDNMIHPYLKAAKLRDKDYEDMLNSVYDEVLSGFWLDNLYLGDAYFEVYENSGSSSMFLSASETLKLMTKTIAKHLTKIMNDDSKLSPESQAMKAEDYKFDFYLKSLVKSLIHRLKSHDGPLTFEKRMSIVDNSLRELSKLYMTPEQLKIFVKKLHKALEKEIKSLPQRLHIENIQTLFENEPDAVTTYKEIAIINPLIESIKRFRNIAKAVPIKERRRSSGFVVKDLEFDNLRDHSRLPPLDPMTAILGHYSRDKKHLLYPKKRKSTRISLQVGDDLPLDNASRRPSPSTDTEKRRISFSEQQRRDSSVTVLNLSEEKLDSDQSRSSPGSSLITITKMKRMASISQSLMPPYEDSIKMCPNCQICGTIEFQNPNDPALSGHGAAEEIENRKDSDENIIESIQSSSHSRCTYSTEEPLIDGNEAESISSVVQQPTKTAFLHRKLPLKSLRESMKNLSKKKISLPDIHEKEGFFKDLDEASMYSIHTPQDSALISVFNMPPREVKDQTDDASKKDTPCINISFDRLSFLENMHAEREERRRRKTFASLRPLYTTSLYRRQSLATSTNSSSSNSTFCSTKRMTTPTQKKGPHRVAKKEMYSTPTQTQKGEDAIIQTSNSLLPPID